MYKVYSEASGDRVLMEQSLKLIYAEYLESGKIYPIQDIDKLDMEEIAERLGTKLAFEARYKAMPIVAKLELKFGIVSFTYSEKLSVSRFTEIIKQL